MFRTDFLRECTIKSVHKKARVFMDESISFCDMNVSLPERKAYSLKYVFENMPPYIGEDELIVGSRTMYKSKKNQSDDLSDILHYYVMPTYMNDDDYEKFGGWEQMSTKGHYTCDYAIILEKGIGGIIEEAKISINNHKNQNKKDYLSSVIIAYTGLSNMIKNYSTYAETLSASYTGRRKEELLGISKICEIISEKPAYDFWSAAQLFWFAHLATIVENFQFMNYGRVDQFLYPYLNNIEDDKAQQLVECLLMKMYDQVDLCGESPIGTYAAQHNITLGGRKPTGEDAVNKLSHMFISGIEKVNLPEPEVSIRIHKDIDEEFFKKACSLSVTGHNYIAYYNDDLFIPNLINKGIPPELANDYSFDLCQDICVAGKTNWFFIGGVSMIDPVLDEMKISPDNISFDDFLNNVKINIKDRIHNDITWHNKWLEAVHRFNNGDEEFYIKKVKANEIPLSMYGESPTSPLPISSGMFHGCIKRGIDLSMRGQENHNEGYNVCDVVVGINSLVALKKVVFEDKLYTLSKVRKACEANFENYEELRQSLWNAPKWGNDDDYADNVSVEIIEYALKEMSKYKVFTGEKVLAGIHQPHPVFRGNCLEATPEGRFNGMPIPVTLTPENGTSVNGPTASFKSAAKINPLLVDWNNCLMLQYFAETFSSENGVNLFKSLLKNFFKIGGMQHQPNVLNVEHLKAAKLHPELYKDLTVRLWGVSAHFVDITPDQQDEIIARYENLR